MAIDVAAPAAARLVIVAGSGRSGTSAATGVLKHLGLHVPQPEVQARGMNPRGFFEPEWVVRFHTRLLRRAQVSLQDARPDAFLLTERASSRPDVRGQLRDWLAPQFTVAPEVVVKDPRNAWFLPLWEHCAREIGVAPRFLTMLRHPVEVVASKEKVSEDKALGPGSSADRSPVHGGRYGQSWGVANWLNLALFTELATRESPRAFLRYDDLLADWRGAITRVADTLDLSMRSGFDPDRARAADEFIDPSLRRSQATWDDVAVSARLRDLAERVWQELSALGEDRDHRSGASAALDNARRDYVDLYAEAEAVAHSSIVMARRRATRRAAATSTR